MPWKLLGEAWKWNIFYDMRHKSHQSYSRDGITFDRMEWKTFSITVEQEEKEKRSSQSCFDVEETWRLAAERRRRWMRKFSNFKWYPRATLNFHQVSRRIDETRILTHFFCVRERKSLIKFPLIDDGTITTTTESTIRGKKETKTTRKKFPQEFQFDELGNGSVAWQWMLSPSSLSSRCSGRTHPARQSNSGKCMMTKWLVGGFQPNKNAK